jgi:signal transduction histidine kinase
MASTAAERIAATSNRVTTLSPDTNSRSRSALQRWLAAAVFGAAALAITLLLRDYLGQTIFVFFFGAIALTSWYSGPVPAFAILGFGLAATNYFVAAPINTFRLDTPALISTAALGLIGTLIAWLTSSLTRTRALLAVHADQLQTQTVELEAQYEESQVVTEELELSHHELAEMVDQAQAANRAKNDFLAVMSHELRTPLNAIVGYADLLQTGVSGPLNETQKTHLSRIRSSSFHLLDLIQDVLSFSRIEAGREELRVSDVEVQQLAQDAFTYIEQECARKGLDARLDVPSDRIVMVTDPAKVRQILLNLLNNACKFTDSGYVAMRVRQDRDDVVFTVDDSGPGIAPEHTERVFEPFTQIDQSTTRVKGGAGLGLPVSRRLAHLLGGSLDLESKRDPGSRFVLRLPIRARLG